MFGIRKDYLYFGIVIALSILVSMASWKMANSIAYNTSFAIIGEHGGSKGNKNSLPIEIKTPKILGEIKSPVFISGKAKGTWFFEGSFLVKITDNEENVLGQGPVTANSNWMTEAQVPFEGTIPFQKGNALNGFVIFVPDDPSGLERYPSVKIPVVFEEDKILEAKCTISGCSAQICSDESMASTCEFREEYACYRDAKCERQTDGKCAWIDTPELKQCIEEKRALNVTPIY